MKFFEEFFCTLAITPLIEKIKPLVKLEEALVELILVHLHPGVEQLHLELESGAGKDNLGHVLREGLAVKAGKNKFADGFLGRLEVDCSCFFPEFPEKAFHPRPCRQ